MEVRRERGRAKAVRGGPGRSVTLVKGLTVTGTVTGREFDSAYVKIGGEHFTANASANDGGRFRVEGIPHGRWPIEVDVRAGDSQRPLTEHNC